MDKEELRYKQITEGVKAAIAQALERHRKLGESIAVWQDGKVVVLSADQIPLPHELIDKNASTSSTKNIPKAKEMNTTPEPTHLSADRVEYLRQQEALFEQEKPNLLNQYLEEFVAFEDGQVLDHDRDERLLVQRVYQKYGYRDLLIRRVVTHEPHFSVGGAFTTPQES